MKHFCFRVGIALIAVALLSLNCAKIAAPPGGPEDKSGPQILSSLPATNSTKILKDNKLIVEFSESVNKESVENSVFVSPRMEGELDFKWNKNILTIIFPDSFYNDITYVVNLGSNISDLHRNKMDSTNSIAFTTGEKLNRGRLQGKIIKSGKAASGITAALYEYFLPDSLDKIDSLLPSYLIQSGKDGKYDFNYLPVGEYFLLAFEDKNKNGLPNIYKESHGVSDRIAVVSEDEFDINQHILFMTELDSSSLAIISTVYDNNGLIKVRFNRTINMAPVVAGLDKIYLLDSTGNKLRTISLKEDDTVSTNNVYLYFGELSIGKYQLTVDTGLLATEGQRAELKSPEFKIEKLTDNSAPTINYISHEKNRRIYPDDNVIKLVFSEPVEFSLEPTPFELIRSDSDTYQFSINRPDPFRANLEIENLLWNEQLTLSINQQLITDNSGNILGDSTVQYKFRTFNEDSLGSVTGNISIDTASGTIPYLEFRNSKGKVIVSERMENTEFEFSVPPDKYLLGGFLDRNNNGRFDAGSLVPFIYSEKRFSYPDTVRVRARFESAGVNLDAK